MPASTTTTTLALVEEHFRKEAERYQLRKQHPPKPKVLLVDDDEDFNLQVRTSFARQGLVIETAINGHEGLTKALNAQPKFDLIILDMRMPGLNGLDVFTRIKQRLPDARVLICTSYPDAAEVHKAMHIGCFGLMEKPVDVQKLAQVFAHYNITPKESDE